MHIIAQLKVLAQWFLARIGISEETMVVFHSTKNHCVVPRNVMRHARPAVRQQYVSARKRAVRSSLQQG
jgi:hypothetical protein